MCKSYKTYTRALCLLAVLCTCQQSVRAQHLSQSKPPCRPTLIYDPTLQQRFASNPAVAPCIDFYSYACSQWARSDHTRTNHSQRIASGIASVLSGVLEMPSATNAAQRTTQRYYTLCRRAGRFSLDNYELFATPADCTTSAWRALGRLRRYGLNLLVQTEVRSNATHSYLTVDRAELPMLDEWEQELNYGPEVVDSHQLEAFQLALNNLTTSNTVSEYRIMELLRADAEADIDWAGYLAELWDGQQPPADVRVLVYNIDYLRQLHALLKRAQAAVSCAYVRAQWAAYLRSLLPDDATPSSCIVHPQQHMSLALNHLYAQQAAYSLLARQTAVTTLFQRLQQLFLQFIANHPAQLNATEQRFLQLKVERMRLNIGNLPQANASYYRRYYAELRNTSSRNFYAVHLQLLLHATRQQLELLTASADAPARTFIAGDHNPVPFYDQQRNMVVLPFSYLHAGPSERTTSTDGVYYAWLGATLGHELLHAFNTLGLRYDAYGNYAPAIFNALERNAFRNALRCLEQRHNDANLDERIADAGGFRLAFEQYFYDDEMISVLRHPATLAQMLLLRRERQRQFFVQYAQFFCTAQPVEDINAPVSRVHSVMANLPQFAEVFGCMANAPLNPSEKCALW